jgi:hypothetical protein
MRQLNYNIIPVQTAATVNSSPIEAINLLFASAQIISTGAGAGTLKFQASNDVPNGTNSVVTNWSDIPSATVSVSGAGAFLIPKIELSYEWIRLVYTNTGTGTISVNVKVLGA